MRRKATAAALVALALLFMGAFVFTFAPSKTTMPVKQDCKPQGAVAPVAASGGTESDQQRANALTIMKVGASMGVAPQGQVIAIATSMVESNLLNLDHGDRDSIGLFQQRPSQGWGSVAQIMDPTYSAGKFYERLLGVSGWSTMDPGVAAQSVQRSAFPSRYSTKMPAAQALYDSLSSDPSLPPVPANVAAGVDPCVDTGPIALNFQGGQGSFSDGPAQAFPRANPRTIPEAVAWAQQEAASGNGGWYRKCLAFTAITYGWSMSGVNYAIDHYTVVPPEFRHDGDRHPMPGALLYWDTGSRAGHIAVYLGGGMLASNDIVTDGQISVVPADEIEKKWGAGYVGWTPPYFPKAG